VGSGATWREGTDYTNLKHRERMKEVVRQKVLDLRGEEFVLMWLLGNENNMSGDHTGVNATRTNAGSQPQAWAEFVNEVAKMIHELDPDHPVAIGNLGSGLAEYYGRHAPAVDVFGMTAYMGLGGFGNTWNEARAKFDRPVLIIEYGCDAYADGQGPDEEAQARYHEGCLRDIVLNQAGGEQAGNSIGGIAFEYLDEWWKANDDPHTQTTQAQGNSPFPDGKGHEEWFGIVSQGSGRNSPFERRLRKAYEFYKSVWGTL
jgi:beta-galactosidase